MGGPCRSPIIGIDPALQLFLAQVGEEAQDPTGATGTGEYVVGGSTVEGSAGLVEGERGALGCAEVGRDRLELLLR